MDKAFKNFVKYRFLLVELVKKEIKLKYRRSYLGIFWTLLEPILTTVVLTLVFTSFRGNEEPFFPIYILTGRLLYSFFSNSTKGAMKAIRGNSGMIKKVYVPKYIYPLSSVLANYITFLISMIVLFIAVIVFRMKPTGYLVQGLIPLFLILVLSLGMGLILATLAVFFRDLEYLWGVILMLLMYTSAIFYKTDTVIEAGRGWVFYFNPLYYIIVNFRNAVYGRPMDMEALLIASLYSVGSLMIGVVLFYKQQDKFILNI